MSLSLASANVFYTLRLGRFSDFDPTLKMMAFIMPFIILLISGPLFCIILMSTFFHGYVFLYVAIIICLNALIIKIVYFRRSDKRKIKVVYHINNQANIRFDELAKQESNSIFLTSVFTSWISPCTVWYNNFEMKSCFLIVLSSLTMIWHASSLLFHYLVINLFSNHFPNDLPLFHCFGNESTLSKVTATQIFNASKSRIEVCLEDCLPTLSFCSPSDHPSQLFNSYIAPLALILLTCSFASAIALQFLGHYYVLYQWTNIFLFKNPIVHLSLLTDFMENAKNLPKKTSKKLRAILNKTIEHSGREYFIIDDGDSLTDNRNLMFFAIEFKFTGVVCRLIKVLKDINFGGSGKRYLKHLTRRVIKKKSVDEAVKKILATAKEHDWPVLGRRKVWQEQPMLYSLKKMDLKAVCCLHIIGANLGVCNDRGKSATEILLKLINGKGRTEVNNDKVVRDDEKDDDAVIDLKSLGCLTRAYINRFLYCPSRHSLLQSAIQKSFNSCAAKLIRNGARINFRESLNGKTCLHYAAAKGDTNIIEMLLRDRRINVGVKDISGRTPLHYAAEAGQLDAVKLLTAKLPKEPRKNDEEEKLSEKGKKMLDLADKGGRTPLYLAATEGHVNVMEYLVENGAVVNTKAEDGSTPLLQAARNKHDDVVSFLIEKKADVNVKDEDNMTPLHFAAKRGNYKAVDLLVRAGAKVNVVTKKGWTPLLFTIDKGSHATEKGSLATKKGSREIVDLLTKENAKTNRAIKESRKTALHIAAAKGYVKITKSLVSKGANVDAKDKDGWRPLHYAAHKGHKNIAKLLVGKGADRNVLNRDRMTPLMLAADGDYAGVVEILTKGDWW